jgi:hypothetical protein
VTLRATKSYPVRELHGRALNRFYAEQDERKAMFRRMGEQLMAKARQQQ